MFKNNLGALIAAIFFLGLYLFLQLSAWQVFENTYQALCSYASGGWHVFGSIMFFVSLIWFYLMATDSNYVTRSTTGNVLIMFVLMIICLCGNFGFYEDFRAVR